MHENFLGHGFYERTRKEKTKIREIRADPCPKDLVAAGVPVMPSAKKICITILLVAIPNILWHANLVAPSEAMFPVSREQSAPLSSQATEGVLESAIRAQASPVRRVNATHFDGEPLERARTAIFWFGRVTPEENSVDVRVGYTNDELWLHVAVFDKRVWYDTTPSPQEITEWDAAEVYLRLSGNEGNAPTADSYRFISQLDLSEPSDAYQAVYRGNGTTWEEASVSFTNRAFYRGDVPNNDVDDRGWGTTIEIPFASLGLSGPPSHGSTWGLAVIVHDRDNASGAPPIAYKAWPESVDPDRPGTWGQLGFGFPEYDPPLSAPGGTVTIRRDQNGPITDGAVGGGTNCGDGLSFWSEWGEENYAGRGEFNVQNQIDVADWPCFSKVYLTFPLGAIPSGKVIISATLVLHEFGNAGNPGEEIVPSWIQVLTIADSWDEGTLTWNNAPLAVENIAMSKVHPVAPVEMPGVPFDWDVSLAVAEAYETGEPLRIAMYSADTAYSTGKYFVSSDTQLAEGHPELTVTWGESMGSIHKMVWPTSLSAGQQVTYTISVIGSGHALTLTDDLPAQVGWVGPIQLEGVGNATYDPLYHRVSWTGTPTVNQFVKLAFPVSVSVSGPLAVYNTAVLTDALSSISSNTTLFIVDAFSVYLPAVLREW